MHRPTQRAVAILTGTLLLGLGATAAQANPHDGTAASPQVTGYSDALDKATADGAEVGGLSSMAYDKHRHAWASTVDNHADDPARIWFYSTPQNPHITGDPLILRKPDGTPYTGKTADNEGLAITPQGDYLVSSETEPTIRVFGRDGVEKASLPMPGNFGVTGKSARGQATDNATLEGLTLSPNGQTLVASMEGPLSGDVTANDATAHRLLVYRKHGQTWNLEKQVGYRTQPGNRIPEVQFYGKDNLLVEEAAWSADRGNTAELYAVTNLDTAPDVTAVPHLAKAPGCFFLTKSRAVDVTALPSQGAPAHQTQTNPLMDNYEGMAVTGGQYGVYDLSLISDDNFNPNQITRIVSVKASLPG